MLVSEGKPAVIPGIQKQPTADTIHLDPEHRGRRGGSEEIAASRHGGAEGDLPPGEFYRASISTLQGKLIGASVFVAVILFFFLGTLRPTVIALTAIPVSIFATALVLTITACRSTP